MFVVRLEEEDDEEGLVKRFLLDLLLKSFDFDFDFEFDLAAVANDLVDKEDNKLVVEALFVFTSA